MKFIPSILLLTLISLFASRGGAQAPSPHAQTVQSNYAAFGKGDIPSILSSLTDDCSWTQNGNPAIIPFAGTFRGKQDIATKFFSVIPTQLKFDVFEPRSYTETPNKVVYSVFMKGQGALTGKPFENIVQMEWTFNDEGKITSFITSGDTSALEAALTK
jgi:hypothetical protein